MTSKFIHYNNLITLPNVVCSEQRRLIFYHFSNPANEIGIFSYLHLSHPPLSYLQSHDQSLKVKEVQLPHNLSMTAQKLSIVP